ncbi:uncharacterized protein LOC126881980 isoform X2 [Diabrotica virgifera virgifera]|uniref:Uncharacterized protein n=1 Tax=Diabrotica virgifera virgifera TaxID=50390 RepID=A0ABM5JXP2_DIAVI|nr:uncharacterized protein LOC126881980 isoform X2 [Diabrotica virgifera virgifera]
MEGELVVFMLPRTDQLSRNNILKEPNQRTQRQRYRTLSNYITLGLTSNPRRIGMFPEKIGSLITPEFFSRILEIKLSTGSLSMSRDRLVWVDTVSDTFPPPFMLKDFLNIRVLIVCLERTLGSGMCVIKNLGLHRKEIYPLSLIRRPMCQRRIAKKIKLPQIQSSISSWDGSPILSTSGTTPVL